MTEASRLGYVIVTDYVTADGTQDLSDAIQKIIDDNPNRTIYFPDGAYRLDKPICTPADPKKSVDLHLSNYAAIRAGDKWSSKDAMIRLGGKDAKNDIGTLGSFYSFTGGIVDGRGKANGISIESGRETAVRNVSIKNTIVGIHIFYGANSGSSDSDIYNVNIVGAGGDKSVGVLIQGYDNTLTNMRIANVHYGINIQSSGNMLRNIHPLYYRGSSTYIRSCGFYDAGGNNWYDYCYSDQMATAFRLSKGSKAVFLNCFAMWYSKSDNKEEGFECDGDFNGSILNAKIHFRGDVQNTAFLTQPEGCGGEGIIENPITNDDLIADKTYKKYVTGKIIRA